MALIPSIPTRNIGEGLDFILSHLSGLESWSAAALGVLTPEHIDTLVFPRTISTKATEGRQVLVYSRGETLAWFEAANWLDCRISAYPPNSADNPSIVQRFVGFQTATPTELIIMIDLDRCNFNTERGFNIAFTRALTQIQEKLGSSPTILWSGRGYHIIVPLSSNGVILENVKQFEGVPNISVKFLRYAELYLSLKKSDPQHNNTVSFNNCMLRIPGSINSKNNGPVKIIQKWDGIRSEINYILAGFTRFIINEKYMELLRVRKRSQINSISRYESGNTNSNNNNNNNNKINWIEQLLQTSIADHRKYCLWRIITPYLLNKRKLSHQESIAVTREWLERCSQLKMIDFNISQRINDGLDGASEGYMPIAFEKLKEENPQLYQSLEIN